MTRVELHPLRPALVRALADAAEAGARPADVMPLDGAARDVAAADGGGWTPALRRRYVRWQREQQDGTATWAVVVDGRVLGAARLRRLEEDAEAGVWLVRSARGRGLGRVVLRGLAELAAADGARRLVATTGVPAARAVLLAAGAVEDGAVEDGAVEDGAGRFSLDLRHYARTP